MVGAGGTEFYRAAIELRASVSTALRLPLSRGLVASDCRRLSSHTPISIYMSWRGWRADTQADLCRNLDRRRHPKGNANSAERRQEGRRTPRHRASLPLPTPRGSSGITLLSMASNELGSCSAFFSSSSMECVSPPTKHLRPRRFSTSRRERCPRKPTPPSCVGTPASHRPSNTASRFSMNASMPSRESADLSNGSSCRKTWWTWSLKPSLRPMRIIRLAA